MSDQYTRITAGGSPLDKTAPVVGLLFGVEDGLRHGVMASAAATTGGRNTNSNSGPTTVLRIKDADDIPVEISDSSRLQVDLHKAVFPQHRVVGWYRVVSSLSSSSGGGGSEEPTPQDLQITQTLKASYAPDDSFCFCLLNVQQENDNDEKKVKPTDDSQDAKMKSGDDDDDDNIDEDNDEKDNNTLNNDLPINLFELKDVNNSNNNGGSSTTILLNIPDWQLETSDAERIAVERVMKEKPSEVEDGSPSHNPYMVQTKAIQHSLVSMRDRVKVIVRCLEDMQSGKIPPNPSLLRQIQGLVSSLGPLSTLAGSSNDGQDDDVELLAHMAIVARTVNAIQSYTDKFRVIHENKTTTKEMRRMGF
jgi:Maintenance of mitochondrial structure and function